MIVNECSFLWHRQADSCQRTDHVYWARRLQAQLLTDQIASFERKGSISCHYASPPLIGNTTHILNERWQGEKPSQVAGAYPVEFQTKPRAVADWPIHAMADSQRMKI